MTPSFGYLMPFITMIMMVTCKIHQLDKEDDGLESNSFQIL